MSAIAHPVHRRICWVGSITAGSVFTLLAVVLLIKRGVPGGNVHDPSIVVLVLIGLLMIVTLFPLVRNYYRNDDPLEPVVVLGGMFFLYYPLNAFGIIVLDFGAVFPAFRRNSEQLLEPFTIGLIVITMGVVSFYVGYFSVRKQSSRPLLPTVPNREPVPAYLLPTWAASACLYLLFALGVIPRGNALLGLIAGFHQYVPAMFVILYYRRDGSRIFKMGTVLLILIEFAILAVVDFQLNQVFIQMILLTVAYNYVGPGLTYVKLSAIGSVIVVLFPVAAIIERLQSGAPVEGALSLGNSAIESYLQEFVSRFIGMDSLTMIVARTPEAVPYQYGETLLLTIYSFVPRVLWPGKPSIIMCGLNNIHFSGRGPDAGTCAAMTVPGELYWNFGTAGVIAGLFVLGVLVALVYRWFIEQLAGETHPAIPVVLYAIALASLVKIESGVAQMLSGMSKELAFAALILIATTTEIGGSGHPGPDKTAFGQSRIVRSIRTSWSMLVSCLSGTSLGTEFRKSKGNISDQLRHSYTRQIFVSSRETLSKTIRESSEKTCRVVSEWRTLLKKIRGSGGIIYRFADKSRTLKIYRRFLDVARRSYFWRVVRFNENQ